MKLILLDILSERFKYIKRFYKFILPRITIYFYDDVIERFGQDLIQNMTNKRIAIFINVNNG